MSVLFAYSLILAKRMKFPICARFVNITFFRIWLVDLLHSTESDLKSAWPDGLGWPPETGIKI